jgi:hypothetical protein
MQHLAKELTDKDPAIPRIQLRNTTGQRWLGGRETKWEVTDLSFIHISKFMRFYEPLRI